MRRFKSSPRPLLPPRAPEPAPGAVGAEAARDDFKTPSSPGSRSVFPKISPRSLRARRFKRAPRPLLPPRAPERAWSAERAEAARDDFKRRARRDRGAFSRKFLGVLCALGVSNRLRVLCFLHALQSGHGARRGPRPPETISNAELAEIAERFPENFSAFSARSAFQIGLRALCVPRALQSRHGARRGPRQRLFQTPRSRGSP